MPFRTWAGKLTDRKLKSSLHTLAIITVLSLTLGAPEMPAQNNNRVSGLVTDPSGAVIPGAMVTATNTATNVPNNTQTNDRGYYEVSLPVGSYTIEVTKTGFSSVVQRNVVVTVGADIGLDFALQLSTSTTRVNVQSEAAPLISPNSSSTQTTVEPNLVQSLPLAVSGGIRNAADFLKLTPGYSGSAFSARINGGVGLDQEVTIDGATVSPVAFGSGIQGSQNTVPGFSVQEFQVIGSNIDAQYGRTSSGVVQYVYKSGTNQYHGSAFEYLKNEALDARNFFSTSVNEDRQSEFGGDIGGPVVIPKLYDGHNKTFFYAYYDGFRYTTSNTGTFYSLLTPAMRTGDFSAAGIPAIYDPSTTTPNGTGGFTRTPYPGNIIPPSEISPISQYFANLLPNPNRPGLSNNYVGTTVSTNDMDQGLIKLDQIIPTGRISVSYNDTRQPTTSDGPFGQVLSGTFGNNYGHRAILNLESVVKPTVVNHFGASFNRWLLFNHQGGQEYLGEGAGLNAKAGLAGPLDTSGEATITAAGYFLGIGGGVNRIAHQNWRINDDLTWIHGAHEFQFGIQQTRFYTTGLQQAGGFTPFGTYIFSPTETGLPGNGSSGFAPASYLLGDVDSGTYGQQPSQAWLFRYWGLYAQDRWKIRPNLTLSYGLRWEHEPPVRDKLDRIATFDPTLPNPGAGGLPGALEFAGTGAGRSGRTQFANDWYGGFGPRIGLAYSPSKTTVFRAAYGLMYDTNAGPGIFLNQQGYFTEATVTSTTGGVTPAFNWAIGFPPVQQGPYFDPTFANGGSTSYMQSNGARMPQVENWNIGVQHQFPGEMVVDLAYVGTAAHHLLNGNLDYNQLNPQYLSLGSVLTAQVGSPAALAAGIGAPYPGFSGSVAQALRPFPQYQTVTLSSDPIGNNTYNSLQVRVQKRLSAGISFLLTYTLSKDLTDADGEGGGAFLGSAQNYYNLRLEKAVSSSDIPHSFVAAYTYDLPFGENRRFRTGSHIFDRYIIGGWQTSGIVTVQTGPPIGVTTEVSLPGIGVVRPNVVNSQVYGPNNSSFNPGADLYLNPAAFAVPAPFTFGDAPRLFSQVRSPGLREWDTALGKTFQITDRFGVKFKAEFFNILNIVNFGAPNSDINSPSFGQITSAGPSRTGQISATLLF
jgi:hypothetical protein